MNAAPHIVEAVSDLNRRLLPAKLNQTDSKNTALLFGWLLEQGLNPLNMSATELADFFEKRIRDTVFEGKLVWDVEPKALKVRKQLTGPATKQSAAQSENEFAKVKRAGEQADAQKKADADSERQITEAINGIQFIDYRTQRVAYGRTESAKAALRIHVTQMKQRGHSLQVIAKVVSAKIADLYKADERSRERV